MKTYVIAAALAGACVLPVIAQSSGGNPDTLSALLVEVRALRIAVERAASASPQVQLISARLSVQNERVSRAARDADAAHQELLTMQRTIANFATQVTDIEEFLSRETDPTRQKDLRVQQRTLKEQMEAAAATEPRLQARDTELANALAVEQTQWTELNRRFDELERELAGRSPR